jgi:hypothetical protein
MPQVNVGPVIPSSVQPKDAGNPVPLQDIEQPMMSSVFNSPPPPKQSLQPQEGGTQSVGSALGNPSPSPQPSPQTKPQLSDLDKIMDDDVKAIQSEMLAQSGGKKGSDIDDLSALKAEIQSYNGNKSESIWDPNKSIGENFKSIADRFQSGLGRTVAEKMDPYWEHYGHDNVKMDADGNISVREKPGDEFKQVTGDSKIGLGTGLGVMSHSGAAGSDLIKFLLDNSGNAIAMGSNAAGTEAAPGMLAKLGGIFAPTAEAAATAAVGSDAASLPIAGSTLTQFLTGGAGSLARSAAIEAVDYLRDTHQWSGADTDLKDALGQGLANVFIGHGLSATGKMLGLVSDVVKGATQGTTGVVKAAWGIKNKLTDVLKELGWDNLGLQKTGDQVKTALDNTHEQLGTAVGVVDDEARRLLGDNPAAMPKLKQALADELVQNGGEMDPKTGRITLPQKPSPAPYGVELPAGQVQMRAEKEAKAFKSDSAYGDPNGRPNLQKLANIHNGLVSGDLTGNFNLQDMENQISALSKMGEISKENPQGNPSSAFVNTLKRLQHIAREDRAELYDKLFQDPSADPNMAKTWQDSYKEFHDKIGAIQAFQQLGKGNSSSVLAKSLIQKNDPESVFTLKALAPDAWNNVRAEWLNNIFRNNTSMGGSGAVNGQALTDELASYGPETLKEIFADKPDMQAKIFGIAKDATKIRTSSVFSPEQLMVPPSDVARMAWAAGSGRMGYAVGPTARLMTNIYGTKPALDYLMNEGFGQYVRSAADAEQKTALSQLWMTMKNSLKNSKVINIERTDPVSKKMMNVPTYVPDLKKAMIQSGTTQALKNAIMNTSQGAQQ